MDVAAVAVATTEMHVLMLQKWKHPVLLRPVINSRPKGKGPALVFCRTAGSKIESPHFANWATSALHTVSTFVVYSVCLISEINEKNYFITS